MRRVGRAVLGRRSTRSTRNDRAPPPCSPTTIRSPRRSSPSRRNTAGPRRESTGPTITAGPASPGRGPGSYQPARSVAGTSIVLSARNPTGTTRASTPAAAIAIDTGRPPPTRPTAARVGAASPSRGPPGDPLAPDQRQAPGQHGDRPHDPPASPPWPADRDRREPDPPPAGPAAQGARHPDPRHPDPRHPDPPLSGPPVGDATPTGHRGAQGCPQPPARGTGAHVRPRPPQGVWVRAAVHIPLRSERR